MRKVTFQDLKPRPWDLVVVFWERLLQFAKQRDIVSVGPGARISEGYYGTSVVYEPTHPWDHPFRVSVSDRTVSINAGYVDADIPTIKEVTLDGRDKDNEVVPEPVFELEDSDGPGKDGRSFICLVMQYDVERRLPLIDEKDWLTIEHIEDLEEARFERSPGEAIESIAVLYWDEDGKKIVDFGQDVILNVKHFFLPAEEAGKGEHFFAAG